MECAGRALSFWSYQMTQDMFVSSLCWLVANRSGDVLTSMVFQILGKPPVQDLDKPMPGSESQS